MLVYIIIGIVNAIKFYFAGQYGAVGFSDAAFISCLIATVLSILDSISDYYACARVCRVPAPPADAVNRGILIEGLCTFLSGTVGCGHATSTSGGNIGAIGITRVIIVEYITVAKLDLLARKTSHEYGQQIPQQQITYKPRAR